MKKQHPKTKNDVQYMLESLSRGTILPLRYLRRLCERVNLILFRQKMFYVNSQMLFKPTPVRICGDIHGQFPDLL